MQLRARQYAAWICSSIGHGKKESSSRTRKTCICSHSFLAPSEMIVDTFAVLIGNAASQSVSESDRRLLPFSVQLVLERALMSLSCFASEEWANFSKALPIRPKASFNEMLALCANSLVESVDAEEVGSGNGP